MAQCSASTSIGLNKECVMVAGGPDNKSKLQRLYCIWPKFRTSLAVLASVLYIILVWAGISIALSGLPIYATHAILQIRSAPHQARDPEKVTSSARPEQIARPQITILESETVIRRAIAAAGEEKLYPKRATFEMPWKSRLSPRDAAYVTATKKLSVRSEPLTDMIKLSFRHDSPEFSVAFLKALVQSFHERHFDLYGNGGAAAFFWDQKSHSDEVFARSSAQLVEFSVANQI